MKSVMLLQVAPFAACVACGAHATRRITTKGEVRGALLHDGNCALGIGKEAAQMHSRYLVHTAQLPDMGRCLMCHTYHTIKNKVVAAVPPSATARTRVAPSPQSQRGTGRSRRVGAALTGGYARTPSALCLRRR
eukprot:scaffold18403_cov99-Isochrysis_galbana.AAC.7